jgi:hypothetical protein
MPRPARSSWWTSVHPGGEKRLVKVAIAPGLKENQIAKTIREAFRAQLPKDAYRAEVDDGEDVLVKKRSRAADFALKVESSTLNNVSIYVEKE